MTDRQVKSYGTKLCALDYVQRRIKHIDTGLANLIALNIDLPNESFGELRTLIALEADIEQWFVGREIPEDYLTI